MRKIEKDLKNKGIEVIEKITAKEKQAIVEKVAQKLSSLKNKELSYEQIIEKLKGAKMCRAQMIMGIGNVNYVYKNKTIYFDKNIDIEEIDESVIHECIHYIQDKRGKHQKMQRMGLCTFEEYKVRGMAINEAGIKYITRKLFNKYDTTKVFILLKQMILITGEQIFIDSILNSSDKFEEKFMDKTNTEGLYYNIQKGLDLIFDLEQEIKRLMIEGKVSTNFQEYISKINIHKSTINKIFLELQWQIYIKYFSRKIELIDKLEEIDEYKNEIFNFNSWLEIVGEELKYTEFTTEKLKQLEQIKIELIRENNSMVIFEQGTLYKIIRKIRKIFFKPNECEENK